MTTQIHTKSNQQELATAVKNSDSILQARQQIQIIKLPELLQITKDSRSNAYLKIADGTLPPQVPLGDRSVGFLKHEVLEVLKARITGSNKEQLKQLVKSLVKQRQLLA